MSSQVSITVKSQRPIPNKICLTQITFSKILAICPSSKQLCVILQLLTVFEQQIFYLWGTPQKNPNRCVCQSVLLKNSLQSVRDLCIFKWHFIDKSCTIPSLTFPPFLSLINYQQVNSYTPLPVKETVLGQLQKKHIEPSVLSSPIHVQKVL